MCSDPACPSTQAPPPGEQWCPVRLDVELERALTGYPMHCGTPHPVTLKETP